MYIHFEAIQTANITFNLVRPKGVRMNELLVFLGILVVLQPPAPAQGKGGFFCSAGRNSVLLKFVGR